MKVAQVVRSSAVWVITAIAFAATLFVAPEARAAEREWVVTSKKAAAMIDAGATVLDARGKSSFSSAHIAGAQLASWQEFSRSKKARRGQLLADDGVLQAKLRAKGVSKDRAVVVVGDPLGGWGEDGRIVWMLRTLGHDSAVLVDGGHDALVKRGVKTGSGVASEAKPGDFEVKRTGRYSITKKRLKKSLAGEEKVVIIDTREAREFTGQTPYGESRGGHVPGAVHIHFSEFIGADGKLLPEEKMRAKLAELGVEDKSTRIVAYCTGGVRSGWFVAVLQDLGYKRSKNYAGSMWEWSAASAEEYPLEKE